MSYRIIARLDIKGPNLIKGVHLEGLRKVGDPNKFAVDYYQQGADELIMMDVVASLYGRNNLLHIVEKAVADVFIPITVGGGIRSTQDVQAALKSGADKVAINTAAIRDASIISNVANQFGSQCMVLSIEAKQSNHGVWECYTDNGREKTGKDVVAWAVEGVERGAGEILLTSVDREGTRKGYDLDLVRSVSQAVSVPVVASGGMGSLHDLYDVIVTGKADAVAIADHLHYKRSTVSLLKDSLSNNGIEVRCCEPEYSPA